MKQQLFIDNVDGRTVHGHILLSNYKPDEIEVILHTFVEVKGKVGTEKINIASHPFLKQNFTSTSLKIPFSVDLDIIDFDTYQGKYISFNYTVEAEIKSNSIKSKRCKQYVYVNRDYSYSVEESQPNLYFTDRYIPLGFYVMIFLFVCMFFLVVPSFFFSENDAPPLLNWLTNKSSIVITFIADNAPWSMLGLSIFSILLYIVSSRIMTKKNDKLDLNIDLRNDLDGFLVKFKYNRNLFELKDFWYEVYEIAIDDRGTTTSISTNELFKSKVVTNSDSQVFKFPDSTGIKSMGTRSSAIRWEIKGRGVRKGLFSKKKKFSAIFQVNGDKAENIHVQRK